MKYTHREIAFLTQHGKDQLLQPLFKEATGYSLVRATGYDTDQLGTFTRDIQRPGSQMAAARFKAHKAIELTGLPVGLGSEGTFGADPVGGLLPWNSEVLVWYDSTSKLEIIGVAQGPGGGFQQTVNCEEDLLAFAERARFPSHGLVLRPDDANNTNMYKGLTAKSTLITAFRATLAMSKTRQVFAEVDLRAHMNPTRQQMIKRAAEDLIAKLRSPCPRCDEPGFSEKDRIAGLLCALCSNPTRLPAAKVWRCDACGFSKKTNAADTERADPSQCDLCNP